MLSTWAKASGHDDDEQQQIPMCSADKRKNEAEIRPKGGKRRGIWPGSTLVVVGSDEVRHGHGVGNEAALCCTVTVDGQTIHSISGLFGVILAGP